MSTHAKLGYKSVHLDTLASGGHAVLLLHAFPLSSEMWTDQLAMLEQHGIAALAPNVFGVEGSQPLENWTFGLYSAALSSLLASLDIGTVTVVGLSMGGYQAFEFWRHHPEKVASLVLCDTKAEKDDEAALANRRDFIAAVREGGPKEAVERMLPNVFAPETFRSQPDAVERFKDMVARQSGEVIAATMQAIASRPDSVDTLATITHPVTIITGLQDKLTPPALAESMRMNISDSSLHLVPEAGHLSNLEKPDVFNGHLLEHLQKII